MCDYYYYYYFREKVIVLCPEDMNFFYNLTNLSLAEKGDHFDSILKFCHNNVSDEENQDNLSSSSRPKDLTLRSQDPEGKIIILVLKLLKSNSSSSGTFVSTHIHCAMLCSQSSYLQSLIQSNTSDSVIILPEVKVLEEFFSCDQGYYFCT